MYHVDPAKTKNCTIEPGIIGHPKRDYIATTCIDLRRYWAQNTYCCESNSTSYQGCSTACPSSRFKI